MFFNNVMQFKPDQSTSNKYLTSACQKAALLMRAKTGIRPHNFCKKIILKCFLGKLISLTQLDPQMFPGKINQSYVACPCQFFTSQTTAYGVVRVLEVQFFSLKKIWICTMIRHHAEQNIDLLLTRNLPFDSKSRQ